MWNQKDANEMYVYIEKVRAREITANDFHKHFLRLSGERWRTQGRETLHLLYFKPYYMWRKDSGPVDFLNQMHIEKHKDGDPHLYSKKTLQWLYGVTDGYYFFIIVLFLAALARKWRREETVYLLFVLLFCGLFALHLVLETAERYHYFGVVAMIFVLPRLVRVSRGQKASSKTGVIPASAPESPHKGDCGSSPQ